jgi:hypothetical protein
VKQFLPPFTPLIIVLEMDKYIWEVIIKCGHQMCSEYTLESLY